MQQEYRRKARIALGLSLICAFFVLEAWNADRPYPSAATPYLQALLGSLAVLGGALSAWFFRKARKSA